MDIDSSEGKADAIDEVKEFKDNSAISDRSEIAMWPMVNVGDYTLYYSAMMAANLQYLAANNNGVPSASPSNKDAKITGLCLADGTEVIPRRGERKAE